MNNTEYIEKKEKSLSRSELEKKYSLGRFMYNCEAALEYFIALIVSGSFLATITKELGFSDSLTGVISSIISLGCFFQLLSILIVRQSYKKFVISLSVINQLLFMFLYIIPLIGGNKTFKTALFIVTIVLAYFFYNIAHPKKINWMMSLVDDEIRGLFTANKENISRISGVIFTYSMSAIVDYFKAKGQIRTAFIITAIVIFIIMILHTLSMILTIEKKENTPIKKISPFRSMLSLLKDKNLLKVMLIFIIWNMTVYSVTPFQGTYQINELGFSLSFVTTLSILNSAVCVIVSKFMGRYADRHSFEKMLRICFIFVAIGFFIYFFAVPSNGKLVLCLFNIFYAIGMSGIGSASMNLIFDYVDYKKRANALALSFTLQGIIGFLSTLVVSGLVSKIQENGNKFLGLNLYAQQVTALIAFIFAIILIIYLTLFIKSKKSNQAVN